MNFELRNSLRNILHVFRNFVEIRVLKKKNVKE